jgi:pilus assembly protein CpaB
VQGRNWILLAIAGVIGIVAVIIANSWFSGLEQGQESALDAGGQGSVDIVVAAQPLAFGTSLTDQNVRLTRWPAASVPQGAFRTIDQALANNRVAIRPIVPGEPVLADKVSGADGRATLSALLPPGMRAVSVPVDAIRGVSGFVLPGMAVDVILTRQMGGPGATNDDLRSDVILENVQVLAVDQTSDETSAEPLVSQTATLAVSLLDAQRLAVAEELGTVSLALRNHGEVAAPAASGGAAPAMATITASDLGGRNLYLPARQVQPQPVPVSATFINPRPEMFQRPEPTGPAAPAARPAARSGPTMVIVRGTDETTYPVNRLGGN